MIARATKSELHRAIHSGNLFVALCDGDEIRIVCRRSPDAARYLSERGYQFRRLPTPPYTAEEADGCYFDLSALDPAMKASELMGLRDHGVPFSGGRGWNPCSVFEHLRDLGLAEGGYWSIWWAGTDTFSVRWEELAADDRSGPAPHGTT